MLTNFIMFLEHVLSLKKHSNATINCIIFSSFNQINFVDLSNRFIGVNFIYLKDINHYTQDDNYLKTVDLIYINTETFEYIDEILNFLTHKKLNCILGGNVRRPDGTVYWKPRQAVFNFIKKTHFKLDGTHAFWFIDTNITVDFEVKSQFLSSLSDNQKELWSKRCLLVKNEKYALCDFLHHLNKEQHIAYNNLELEISNIRREHTQMHIKKQDTFNKKKEEKISKDNILTIENTVYKPFYQEVYKRTLHAENLFIQSLSTELLNKYNKLKDILIQAVNARRLFKRTCSLTQNVLRGFEPEEVYRASSYPHFLVWVDEIVIRYKHLNSSK